MEKIQIRADLAKYHKDGTLHQFAKLAGKVKEVEKQVVKGYYFKYRNKSILVPKSCATVVEDE